VKNAQQLDPEVLAFARSIREAFGEGVRLRTGREWPGGSNKR
jgi:hypothetical protein